MYYVNYTTWGGVTIHRGNCVELPFETAGEAALVAQNLASNGLAGAGVAALISPCGPLSLPVLRTFPINVEASLESPVNKCPLLW